MPPRQSAKGRALALSHWQSLSWHYRLRRFNKIRGVGGAFSHLTHARGDCQDHHAPGLGCESPATLTGLAAGALPGGLILDPDTVPQQRRWDGAACACVWRSECAEIRPDGATQRPTKLREQGRFNQTPCDSPPLGLVTQSLVKKSWFEFPIRRSGAK